VFVWEKPGQVVIFGGKLWNELLWGFWIYLVVLIASPASSLDPWSTICPREEEAGSTTTTRQFHAVPGPSRVTHLRPLSSNRLCFDFLDFNFLDKFGFFKHFWQKIPQKSQRTPPKNPNKSKRAHRTQYTSTSQSQLLSGILNKASHPW